MNTISPSSSHFGAWLLIASAIAATVIAVVNDVMPGNGIHGTPGALLVVISSALILVAGLLLAFDLAASRMLRLGLAIAIVLDIAGTGFAAYLLEARLLVCAMVFALGGWLIHLFAPGPDTTPALAAGKRR